MHSALTIEPTNPVTKPEHTSEELAADWEVEFPFDPEEVEQRFRGPQLLPIRVVHNAGQIVAFLDDDCGDELPWRIPVRRVGSRHIVLTLSQNLRGFWIWNLLDRND